MKKKISFLTFVAFLFVFGFGTGHAQATDITGTWVGETAVPDAPEPDKLTLVITKNEGKYKILFSDTYGYADETECDNVEYTDGELSLTFDISDGYSVQTIYVKLKVEGDEMTGHWENDEGEASDIKLKRKK